MPNPPRGFAVFLRIEQPERRFVERRTVERIDGHRSIRRFSFRQRRLAAADRAEQIQDLLLLFEALRRVPEVGDDLLDVSSMP